MGQGIYTAIGYGIMGDRPDGLWDNSEGDWHDWAWKAMESHHIRYSYEASPAYIATFVAASPNLCDDGIAELDDRVTIPLAALTGALEAFAYKRMTKALKNWDAFRKVCKKHGVELPVGQLLWISDWD